uniref:Protein kinase domain-containing protein n=2 Tax=Corethron hystrix TaxID=216773 RepID=A0A7S1FYQ7_9STRA|mmetsp:Transcript_42500/g.99751  ORF Transcript_42500/g.99751 Transcript_42500/m.99751 type:complete len:542 (+) Transcript_42500:73-1698(+)
MGGVCSSNKSIIPDLVSGDEDDYRSIFIEGAVLGEGEFGKVRVAHLMNFDADDGGPPTSVPYASKVLKKGMTFRHNTIYTAIKPLVLYNECKVLRLLAGKRHCLKLHSLFESPRNIWIVTEICEGGDMIDWLSKQGGMLKTEHVSRIIFQLLDAIDHCHSFGVIHRDVKPENIMFKSSDVDSQLKLIDFGSGTIDKDEALRYAGGLEEQERVTNPDDLLHHTFAGSAFYTSPEMFKRTYTSKTDIWSVGVTSYVVVAGYPADNLQNAFNILQKRKRDLRTLPNLPKDLPDEYFTMLDDMLLYPHRNRKSAKDILQYEFVQFQREMNDFLPDIEIDGIANDTTGDGDLSNSSRKRSNIKSQSLDASVVRHSLYITYRIFERAVASLLAVMLQRRDFDDLIARLTKIKDEKETSEEGKRSLQALPIYKVKEVLISMNKKEIVTFMEKLPNAASYERFVFRISLLRLFSRKNDLSDKESEIDDSVHFLIRKAAMEKKNSVSQMKRSNSADRLKGFNDDLSRSGHSETRNSVHGSNVWEKWKSKA